MEIVGTSLAFVAMVAVCNLIGIHIWPKTLLDARYIFLGWGLLAWIGFGLALTMGALAEMFEFVERFVQVITYVSIPVSGAFYMVAWTPPGFRRIILMTPLIHSFELIRRGFFGEIPVLYNVGVSAAWATFFTLTGLWLVQFVRNRIAIE